jgi:hypothetical protein
MVSALNRVENGGGVGLGVDPIVDPIGDPLQIGSGGGNVPLTGWERTQQGFEQGTLQSEQLSDRRRRFKRQVERLDEERDPSLVVGQGNGTVPTQNPVIVDPTQIRTDGTTGTNGVRRTGGVNGGGFADTTHPGKPLKEAKEPRPMGVNSGPLPVRLGGAQGRFITIL